MDGDDPAGRNFADAINVTLAQLEGLDRIEPPLASRRAVPLHANTQAGSSQVAGRAAALVIAALAQASLLEITQRAHFRITDRGERAQMRTLLERFRNSTNSKGVSPSIDPDLAKHA